MKTTKIILLTFLCALIISCSPDNLSPEPVNDEIGWFPASPVNISDLNTEYNDYNSNINVTGERIDLYYSTNKETAGDNYDITSLSIAAFFNLDTDVFSFQVYNSKPSYAFELLPKINTDFDEYGPFSFYSDSLYNSYSWWYFMYANNEDGNFDIRIAYTDLGDWGHWDAQRQILGPFKATVLNSQYHDFYPTINEDHSKIYFSSNRVKRFNIFEIEVDAENFVNWLKNGKNTPKINTVLSSSGDDKCPYIKGNLMVFASNNTEGYGGYDLWYSIFENGKWSKPYNFGPEINTEYDEYRPAIAYFPESNNDLMIFSSNRPNGKGGFDLYYTGISKMIKK
ncbi:hypothetical protein SLH46_17250 [Draconibacterium sp. IB214405]|uniref:hypothetical protein n=1 Tax=Draconibacterium sp. IB214405 TaxID=3097352 RepID=UPI002A17E2DB|nr:hypothetical protein [Draconibacterium sp. IB214405]MDX8340949.1 hypothetical protein [Draconibacterium sp. IB214405]